MKLETECCEKADLSAHSVAITSTCTMKSERSDEIGTWGKHKFENGFSFFRRNNYLLTKLDCQIVRETTVLKSLCKNCKVKTRKSLCI